MNAWLRIAALLLLCAPAAAPAQDAYPTRPIRIVVPFTAGGPTDIFARAIGAEISKTLGQPVIVDNRPGAGGNLGTEMVAKAPADGYTLIMGAVGSFAVNPTLYAKLPFDVLRDFAPISQVTNVPFVLVVHPGVAAKSLQEFLALARAKPGQMSYGSAGTGTSMHLSTELFKTMAKIDIVHVPYKGASQAVVDLLSGQVQVLMADVVSALPHVKAGKFRPLAITARSALYAEVPSFADAGLPGFDANVWYGLFAPAATPREIVQKLYSHVAKALQTPEVGDRLTAQAAQVVGSTPEQFTVFVRTEIVKWAKVVKESGARID